MTSHLIQKIQTYRVVLLTIALTFVLTLIMLPLQVYAALFGFDFIVCGREKPDCNIGHLFVLADMLVKFMLYLAVPVTVILMSWAGLKYLFAGGDPKKLADAKSMLKHVIFGIGFILSAYLVVHTIFVYFVKDSFRQFGI